ncbi:chaperonin 10-like protein [Aspergillus cavernicola]|uniref:Chaperonin 10-like protein n=1 Tax=Aspergillus cavernicola TaxID=176166 RepID=A0ABR4IFK4_9EURO
MAVNRSVWQDTTGVPGAIRDSPIPTDLEDSKILIKVHAWAVNPCDAILQDKPLPIVTYPVILGQDVAGIVEAVGAAAGSKFKPGDQVFGFSINNGFQDYVLLESSLAAKIPKTLSFVEAAVFPLAVSTASFALFSNAFLGLSMPSLTPANTGHSILIWGGSSAVGSNAIQLAKSAGYEVVTTCSPRNFDYVRSLGADKVFDYNSPLVTEDLVAELDNGTCVGIYMAAGSVAGACQVSHKSKQNLLVASSNPIMPGDAPEGVEAKFTLGGLEEMRDSLSASWGGFLAEALKAGKYQVAPSVEVVPTKGLEGIQEALDLWKKGVSAKKLVIEAI